MAACGGGGGGGETVGAAPPPSTTAGAPSASGAPAVPAPAPTSAPAPASASAPAVTAYGPVVLQQLSADPFGLSAPALTRLSDGTTVAVFKSTLTARDPQLEVHLVDATGRVQGTPITIATPSIATSSVATLANGDWVIGWLESPQGTVSTTFHARRYTATGALVQDIAQPVPLRISFGEELSIAGAPDGGFVAAWTSFPDRTGGYPSLWRFDAAGQPQGPVLTVPTARDHTAKALVMADGGVLLASTNADQTQLLLRHVDAKASGLGDAKVVVTNPPGGYMRLDLQPANGNTAVLAWTTTFNISPSNTVSVQWIDATGAPLRAATTQAASGTMVSAAPRADGSLSLYLLTGSHEETSSGSVNRGVLTEVPVDAAGSLGSATTVLDVTTTVIVGSSATIGPSEGGVTVAPRLDGHDVIGYARGVAGGSEGLVQGR